VGVGFGVEGSGGGLENVGRGCGFGLASCLVGEREAVVIIVGWWSGGGERDGDDLAVLLPVE
jgi:hypothetical protein